MGIDLNGDEVINGQEIEHQNYVPQEQRLNSWLPLNKQLYIDYIVDADPSIARKTLSHYGYPVSTNDENWNTELKEVLYDLFYNIPESYDYLVKLSPEYETVKRIVLSENKKTETQTQSFNNLLGKPKAKNFTSGTTTTDYDLMIAKNKHNTNLLLIGVSFILGIILISNKL